MTPSRSVRVVSPTERRNPRTLGIDRADPLDVLRLLNAEDALVPAAVAEVLPRLAVVVETTTERLRAGGRLHYFGAGTSGRTAVVDAAELGPTFSLPPGTVVAHHAGGPAAMVTAVEGSEDSEELGAADAADVGPGDVAVGVAASGRTPYVAGALAAARAAGAFTALVSANPGAPLAHLADVHIAVDTGPEAIAGSTRLKAASAHKLVLNGLSTAVMVALGRTYSNLMVDVSASNAKLRGRLVTILMEATGLGEERCAHALAGADGELKTALVCLLAPCAPEEGRRRLAAARGRVADALEAQPI
ncbi:N-acetylmuramic acid 6-phosphate etherase [Kitasatospora phosalacinea]|uniref:N-acetylmuramic acid 6-phosphate etherase n=1 Tax=Kitasatospora phosalacinea TaxID=2065 RepID=A0A9W6QF41_9ACTN|nr:N-acetylmuramic acid 6-phosphate etherase [Kitasatospora phosalacinea]GLW73899.1 N-acetylmuramic acid 6-phosphate etherase [Kitasatospora phosalacinea]